MASADFTLTRNAFGRLVLTTADGVAHEAVVPVRAFPIAAPEEGVSLVGTDGRELAWLDNLETLDASRRTLINEELGSREFMPEIKRLKHVSTFATPSQWTVETDRGEATFTLKGEEDIRRLTRNTLLIADSHGIQFLVRDLSALDRQSKKFLDRFL